MQGASGQGDTIFNTVIELSHLCCHKVLYFLSNPSVIVLAHFISALPSLNTLPSASSREGGELGGASQVEQPRASLYLNPALLKPLLFLVIRFDHPGWLVQFIVFNATFNNISVISGGHFLLVEETRVHGENHRPVASHCMTNFITQCCIENTQP